ncbi:MAG: GEVED domain-containing protein [Bacteroidota bacterium]
MNLRKKLLLVSAFACLFIGLHSQTTVTIGTGTLTASGTNGTPIYRSSATSTFHHAKSIQLLTQTQLSAAGILSGAIITQWGYNKTTGAIPSGSNAWTLNVYLKNSANTVLASGTTWNTMITGASLVYTATITSANMPSTPGYWMWPVSGFTYNGGSIECYIEWLPSSTMVTPFTSAAFPWQYTATTGAQAMGTSNSVAIPGTQATWTTQTRFYNTSITFQPPSACTGTPNPGVAAISLASGCPSLPFTLSSSGLTFASGINYQWQSSSSPTGPFTDISGANSPAFTTSVTATTYFQLVSTCTVTSQSNASNVVSYTVNNPGLCICGSYPVFSATSTADEDIGNVTVGSMNNTSTCTSLAPGTGSILNRYSNYTGSITGTSEQLGSTVNFSLTSITCGGVFNNGFQIYIDYNQNGLYTDPGEQVYSSPASISGPHTETGSFVIPLTALVGSTRMRVINVETTFPTATNYAVTNYSWGETEDYCFDIVAAVNCTGTPSGGNSAISISSGCPGVNFNLTNTGYTVGSGVTLQWQSSASATGPWTDIAGATNPNLATSTSTTTFYQLLVTCTNSGLSAASNPVSYTINNPGPCVCGAYPLFSASSNLDEDIGNVTVGTMNNSSTCATVAPGIGSLQNRYSNYSGSVAAHSALQGQSVSFSLTSITCNGNYGNGFQIYIDYNQNGSFADPGEEAYSSVASTTGPHTETGTFTIPITATAGTTRMRVVNVETTFPTTINYATSAYTWGETEDYCFTVLSNPPCSGTPVSGSISGNDTLCAGDNTTLTLNGSTIAPGISYLWSYSFSPNGPFTNADTTITINSGPLNDTIYYQVTVTCSLSGQAATTVLFPVVVNPLPTITFSQNTTTFCAPNGTLPVVTASGTSTSYTWNPPTGLSNASASTVTITPSSTTTYTVTGSDQNGCNNSSSITINYAQGIILNGVTSSNPNVCSGSGTTLSASAVLGSNTYCQPATSCTFPDIISNVTFSTINNPSGCDGASSSGFTLFSAPNPTITAGSSLPISVTTSGDIEGAAVWIDFDQNGNFDPAELITNGFLGTNPATYTATVNVPLNVVNGTTRMRVRCTFSSDPINIGPCASATYGETEDYLVTFTGGVDPLTYNWSPSTFLNVSNNDTVVATNMTYSIDYILTATAASGCQTFDTVSVTVNPLPPSPIISDTIICSGKSTTLSTVGFGSISWYDAPLGGNFISSGNSYTTPVLSSSVSYFVQDSSAGGCASARTQVDVTVNPTPVVALGSDVTQCGGNVVLDAQNTGATYIWSNQQNAQTVNITSTGIYDVAVTNSFSCTGYDTVSITINYQPVVNLGADSSYCSNSISLDALNPGNIYQWNTGDTTQTLLVTASGSYNVNVSTPEGCFANDTVSLVLTPTPIVNLGGDTSLCGGNIILDAQNTGSTYLWSDGSSFPIIFVSTTGTYWVDVTNPQNCTSRDSINVTVSLQPVVNLGPDQNLCNGDTVVLNAGYNLGATYLWNDGSVNQTIQASSTGVYSVIASTGIGCIASDSVLINVYPYPAPNISLNLPVDSICSNVGIVHLTGESPAGGFFSGTSVSGSNFDASVGAGTYLITYTITDSISGCSNSASQNIYVEACLGLNYSVANSYSVYPNPTSGKFFIESNSDHGKVTVELFDSQGKKVYSELFGSLSRQSFDLNGLSNGIYLIKIISADHFQTFRITLNQ